MQVVSFFSQRPFLVGTALTGTSMVTAVVVSSLARLHGEQCNLDDAKSCRRFLWSLATVSISSTLIVGGTVSALHPLGRWFAVGYSVPAIAGALGLTYALAADDKETLRVALWPTAIASGAGILIVGSRGTIHLAKSLYKGRRIIFITFTPDLASLIWHVTVDMIDSAGQHYLGLQGRISYAATGVTLGSVCTMGAVGIWILAGLS
jgi:hypothetical protein